MKEGGARVDEPLGRILKDLRTLATQMLQNSRRRRAFPPA
jgi:hypothetical protein